MTKTMSETHNYGLENFHLVSDNIHVVEKPFKTVLLTNVEECRDKITVNGMTSLFMRLGHFEWEQQLAYYLVSAVADAIKKGSADADISRMFQTELKASYYDGATYGVSQERIHEHIMKAFEVVESNNEVLKVKLKAECIK